MHTGVHGRCFVFHEISSKDYIEIAHRDFKPANVFIDKDKCKLGDFGSACFISGAGMRVGDGTLDYISPEIRKQMIGNQLKWTIFRVISTLVTILHLAKLTTPSNIPFCWKDTQQLKQTVETEIMGCYIRNS